MLPHGSKHLFQAPVLSLRISVLWGGRPFSFTNTVHAYSMGENPSTGWMDFFPLNSRYWKKISSWRKINVISCKESLTTKTHKIPSLSHCLQSEISSLCELWKGCFDWHIRTVTITQWSYLLESCKCPRWHTLVLTRTDVDSFWPWLLPQTCPFLT